MSVALVAVSVTDVAVWLSRLFQTTLRSLGLGLTAWIFLDFFWDGEETNMQLAEQGSDSPTGPGEMRWTFHTSRRRSGVRHV